MSDGLDNRTSQSGVEQLPPNEKEWTEEHRRMIHDLLPGHMVLGDTSDVRVGM